ncbi:6-phosphogluconolactonase [Algoriphagus litoralis]|uniref:6-phosphogluconolactonase n=1 Tax=Algoriphagus litoralis TaxID=2202829 RepID=UPI00130093BD|nr:6-phosphogluconolactonase [Algoriphagus litoralis]
MSKAGFEIVRSEIEKKPDLLFCVASGGSPSGLYAEMVSHQKQNPGFCSRLQVVKLDEWGGLEPGSTFTSEVDVQTKFIQPLGIAADRYLTIDPFTPNPSEECERMKTALEKSPVDICILGIGVNGHIALNEPSDVFQLGFHVAELAGSTLANGMIKSLKQPPTFGMTMGVGEILKSKKILLFISGSGKKDAFQKLLNPEINFQFPASFLWLHPNVDVLVDKSVI